MHDKILDSDFFEQDSPPSCCELLAILFADVTDGTEEVTDVQAPGTGSAPNRSTAIGESLTEENT